MKVCFFPGRESSYPRTRILVKEMRKTGITVYDCSVNCKSFLRYFAAFYKFLIYKGKCDVVFVGFLGQIIVFFVKLFTRKKVLFDAFVSVYQTMVYDRKKIAEKGVLSQILRFIDRRSCAISDRVITDTNGHIKYFTQEFNLDEDKFDRILVGTDEEVFFSGVDHREEFLVHLHGEFQRLHGISNVIEAAALIPHIKFQIIGKGSEFKKAVEKANELNLNNIDFYSAVRYEDLAKLMAKASVCLGVFGDTQKARMVIPNKVYEALAMKKAVITLDTPAVRELLKDRENAILVKSVHPQVIAGAIEELYDNNDYRRNLGENGHKVFKEKCSANSIGEDIKRVLLKMV